MSVDKPDIKEFSENEWNGISHTQKDAFPNFSCKIDVFEANKVDVKVEQHETNETKRETDEKYSIDISDYRISCKTELQQTLIDHYDVKIKNCDIPEDFCSKCRILTYIIHNNGHRGIEDGVWNMLPKNLLEVKRCDGGKGIFALETIPEGIQFGPCEGLQRTQMAEGCSWKLKGGKFVNVKGNLEYSNWMQNVNCAKIAADQNLIIFQYNSNLYYRTKRLIPKGEELLLRYSEKCVDKFDTISETCYNPPVEKCIANTYACTFCSLGFCSKNHLVRHRSMCPHATISSPSQEIVQCKSCKIYLDKNEYLEFHIDRCLEMHARNSNFVSVARVQLGDEFSASSQDIKSAESWRYKEQSQRGEANEKIGSVYCMLCRLRDCKCFERSSSLNEESRLNTSNQCKTKGRLKAHNHEGPFACHRCDFQTIWQSSLNVHMSVHNRTKPFKCELCSRGFKLKSGLKSHILIHTGDKPFACRHCDYKARRSDTLNSHMRLHETVKPYECEICNKRFTQKYYIKKHILVHSGEKPFKCALCRKLFRQKSSLKPHILIHTGAKPFACQQCEYKTTHKGALNVHIKTHEGVKSFGCEVCGKCFTLKCNLKKHLRIHSGEKPFACSRCDYKFAQKSHLIAHMKRHGDVKPVELYRANL